MYYTINDSAFEKNKNVFPLEPIQVTTLVNFHSRVNCSFKSDRDTQI